MNKKEVKGERSDDGRLLLNALPYEIVERVADQVCVDIRVRNTNKYNNFDPLRWSMHGGPGTGISHVIQIIKTQ